MVSMAVRRKLALGVFAIFGSATAFAMGASVGTKLERQTRTVSVGQVTVSELQTAASSSQTAPAQTPVARAEP